MGETVLGMIRDVVAAHDEQDAERAGDHPASVAENIRCIVRGRLPSEER
ncbi:hypothetical protein [Azospirillum argentinense]|nr:hypothetical protein [Azospirillum brasilense]